jgi:HlyD family type I secretion membrane fusion protein
VAPGVVRAEANRKTLKALGTSVVERIHVRDGQRVSRGQLLMEFDDTRPKAELDVLKSSYYNLLAERARYEAELRNAPTIVFPAEVLAQAGDPGIAATIRTQQDVFQARRMLVVSQQEVLGQRLQQLDSRIVGLQAQVTSLDEQSRLIHEELVGLRDLHAKGFAPLNRVRALERNASQLGGSKGAQVAEISRAREAIGEARIELSKVRQQQITEAAEKLREIEVRMSDLLPRLRAAEEAYAQTRVVAPVDGYVLNLSQFTEGGVAGGGESLLDIIPSNAPMVIDAKVRPQDIDQVSAGMEARVRLSAYSARLSPEVKAVVTTISADRLVDERTGESYFQAELRVPPEEMRKFAGKKVKLNPGMPADTMIVTGERSILDFLIGPLRDTIGDSLHEE